MAKNVKLLKDVAKKIKRPLSVVKKTTSETERTIAAKNAVNYTMNKIKADDSTLHTSMKKTFASATSELAQLPAFIKAELIKNDKSFAMCLNETIPFIIMDGEVISFKRTSAGEQIPMAQTFGDAVTAHMASNLEPTVRDGKPSTLEAENARSKATISTNLAEANSKIATIVATY